PGQVDQRRFEIAAGPRRHDRTEAFVDLVEADLPMAQRSLDELRGTLAIGVRYPFQRPRRGRIIMSSRFIAHGAELYARIGRARTREHRQRHPQESHVDGDGASPAIWA